MPSLSPASSFLTWDTDAARNPFLAILRAVGRHYKNGNIMTLGPVWTVTANVVKERRFGPGGNEMRIGTKHFRPGTKLYIIDWYAGMCEDIIVVGLARKPRHFIKVIIRADWVENLRIKLCYDPKALERIYNHFNSGNDNISRLNKEFVETMYSGIPMWQKEILKK